MPKPKIEEAGSLSKYERQKLQKLYTQGAAADGSVRNASNKGETVFTFKVSLYKIYFGSTKIQENRGFC